MNMDFSKMGQGREYQDPVEGYDAMVKKYVEQKPSLGQGAPPPAAPSPIEFKANP